MHPLPSETQPAAQVEADAALLRATMDSSMDIIQVFEAMRDDSGDIIDFRWVLNNHAAERVFGDVMGERLREQNPGVVPAGSFDTFRRVVETGVPDQAEYRHVHEQFDGWFFQSTVPLGDGVATTTRDVSERKRAEQELRQLEQAQAADRLRHSEERFQKLVEACAQAVWETDAEGRAVEPSPSWSAFTGQSFEEFRDFGWLDAIHPDDRASAERQWRASVAAGQAADAEFRLRHAASGGWRWTNVRAVPITDSTGVLQKWVGMNVDVHARRTAEEALRKNEARLRNAVDVGRIGLWDWNLETGELHWSDEHYRLYGYAVGGIEPSYTAWLDHLHPEDRGAAEAALLRARDERSAYLHEFRVSRPDGATRWMMGRGSFFYDSSGSALRMVGAIIDTTERREAEDVQRMLVGELQHRVRNILAVVRSVFTRTAATSCSIEDVADHFTGRLDALSRAHVVATHNPIIGIDLENLIRDEMLAVGAHDGPQISIEGPNVALGFKTAEIIGLAIHELTMNAIKYGALRISGGHIDIKWTANMVYGQPSALFLTWQETGVPALTIQPARHGFGAELICEALPYRFGATTELSFAGGGVRCAISLPLPPPRATVADEWKAGLE